MRALGDERGSPAKDGLVPSGLDEGRYAPRPIEDATVAYGMLALPTVGPPYLAGATTLPAAR